MNAIRFGAAAPGIEAGFGYRIVYVDPALVHDALGGRELPFVRDPVQPFTRALASLLADIDEPIDACDVRRSRPRSQLWWRR
jgi:hypothetical protein